MDGRRAEPGDQQQDAQPGVARRNAQQTHRNAGDGRRQDGTMVASVVMVFPTGWRDPPASRGTSAPAWRTKAQWQRSAQGRWRERPPCPCPHRPPPDRLRLGLPNARQSRRSSRGSAYSSGCSRRSSPSRRGSHPRRPGQPLPDPARGRVDWWRWRPCGRAQKRAGRPWGFRFALRVLLQAREVAA